MNKTPSDRVTASNAKRQDEGYKRLTVWFKPDAWAKVQLIARERGTTATEAINAALTYGIPEVDVDRARSIDQWLGDVVAQHQRNPDRDPSFLHFLREELDIQLEATARLLRTEDGEFDGKIPIKLIPLHNEMDRDLFYTTVERSFAIAKYLGVPGIILRNKLCREVLASHHARKVRNHVD